MTPSKCVEVESGESHDGVIDVFLVWNQDLTRLVPDKRKVVVARTEGSKLRRAGSKQRSVLDIRIVLWRVGDEVMDIVGRFPPSKG